MKIGFDVAQTCTERAGCAWYADSVLRAMVECAPQNEYILYHQFGDWINERTSAGTYVDHASVRMPSWDLDAKTSRELWSEGRTRTAFFGSPEIVQSNSFQAVQVPGAKLVFVIYDVSFWVHPEFTTESNRLNCQAGVLRALERADAFLFISESGMREFEKILPGWLARRHKPAAAIPLASRIPVPAKRKKGGKFWLAVGSMEPRKNYTALFSAIDLYWRRSTNPLPTRIVAPKGWRNDDLTKRAAELENQGRVSLLGYVAEDRLTALYQNALALVFVSWYEGFGLPVLEAMQAGCPVICSDRSSLPEVGGDSVMYINPDSPESICEAMLRLEGDPGLQDRLLEKGQLRARLFTWQRTAQETLQFYERVLEGSEMEPPSG